MTHGENPNCIILSDSMLIKEYSQRVLSTAEWDPKEKKALLKTAKGIPYFMGNVVKNKRWLRIEEFVFLSEIGNHRVYYNDIQLSLEELHLILIQENLSMKYEVYSYLSRLGYICIPRPLSPKLQPSLTLKANSTSISANLTSVKRKADFVDNKKSKAPRNWKEFKEKKPMPAKYPGTLQPLLSGGLDNLKFHSSISGQSTGEFDKDYDVYLKNFKQTFTPDFSVAVHNVSDPVPDLRNLPPTRLIHCVKDGPGMDMVFMEFTAVKLPTLHRTS